MIRRRFYGLRSCGRSCLTRHYGGRLSYRILKSDKGGLCLALWQRLVLADNGGHLPLSLDKRVRPEAHTPRWMSGAFYQPAHSLLILRQFFL